LQGSLALKKGVSVFEGQNVLAREIIKKMILKVLDFDESATDSV
jgi:hypothetical protein